MSDDLSALDLLPEAVVVVDTDGVVRHVNRRARSLLGVDAGAGKRPLATVLDLRNDADEPIARHLSPVDGLPAVADRLAERLAYVVLDSGHRRPVAVSGRVLDDGSHVLTFRHAGRRVRLDLNRSDLIATVSHEIRSPLTSVKGFTSTLLAKWDRFSDEQKHQMLATVNEDADRVTRLLTELLDVARIDVDRVQLQRRMVELADILEPVVDRAAHQDGRQVELTIPDGLPELYLDPDKIQQVITNLVDNALRHAPDSPVSVAASEHPDEIEITVADRGPGIPADQLRTIFGKFARGPGAGEAGTGLGLFITRGLVQAHGGRVWAESTEGEGARFHVILPKGGIELRAGRNPAEREDDDGR